MRMMRNELFKRCQHQGSAPKSETKIDVNIVIGGQSRLERTLFKEDVDKLGLGKAGIRGRVPFACVLMNRLAGKRYNCHAQRTGKSTHVDLQRKGGQMGK